jgi:hypothetical protein
MDDVLCVRGMTFASSIGKIMEHPLTGRLTYQFSLLIARVVFHLSYIALLLLLVSPLHVIFSSVLYKHIGDPRRPTDCMMRQRPSRLY